MTEKGGPKAGESVGPQVGDPTVVQRGPRVGRPLLGSSPVPRAEQLLPTPPDPHARESAMPYISPEWKAEMFQELDRLFEEKGTTSERIKEGLEESIVFARCPYYIITEVLMSWKTPDKSLDIFLLAAQVAHLFFVEEQEQKRAEVVESEETLAALQGDEELVGKRIDGLLELYLKPPGGDGYFSTPAFLSDISGILQKPDLADQPETILRRVSLFAADNPKAIEGANVIRQEVTAELRIHGELRAFFLLNERRLRIGDSKCREELMQMYKGVLMQGHPEAVNRAIARLEREFPLKKRWITVLEEMLKP